MWKNKELPENTGDERESRRQLPDGKHVVTVAAFKVKSVDALMCDKISIQFNPARGYSPIFKDYPECYDWAYEAFCKDMGRLMPGVDPREIANSGELREKLIGCEVEIFIKSNPEKPDKNGNPRRNVFINGLSGDGEQRPQRKQAPPLGQHTGDVEDIELDDDEPF